LNNDGTYVGSGGFGWTHELPQKDFDGRTVRTIDMWGFAESQETVGVSPQMFEEFVFQYQLPILERFGLNCYGCCEPLHHKVDVLRRNVPRLRRISMSPFIDFDKAVENVRDEFIFAWKPSPAVLAASSWNPELVRKDMEEKLKKARKFDCVMEIHMKDISTVNYQPKRLWEWAQIAAEVTERYV